MSIESLTSAYDDCQLECDGLTRVLHTVLEREGVPHVVKLGRIENTKTGNAFSPHYWIELPSGEIVDYRARMWLGPSAPHGIFNPNSTPVEHKGREVNMPPLTSALFRVLTGREI